MTVRAQPNQKTPNQRTSKQTTSKQTTPKQTTPHPTSFPQAHLLNRHHNPQDLLKPRRLQSSLGRGSIKQQKTSLQVQNLRQCKRRHLCLADGSTPHSLPPKQRTARRARLTLKSSAKEVFQARTRLPTLSKLWPNKAARSCPTLNLKEPRRRSTLSPKEISCRSTLSPKDVSSRSSPNPEQPSSHSTIAAHLFQRLLCRTYSTKSGTVIVHLNLLAHYKAFLKAMTQPYIWATQRLPLSKTSLPTQAPQIPMSLQRYHQQAHQQSHHQNPRPLPPPAMA